MVETSARVLRSSSRARSTTDPGASVTACSDSPGGSLPRSSSPPSSARVLALPVHGGRDAGRALFSAARHRDPGARPARRPQLARLDLVRGPVRRSPPACSCSSRRSPASDDLLPVFVGAGGHSVLLRRRRPDRLHARRPRDHPRRAVRRGRHLHARGVGLGLLLHRPTRRSSPAASRPPSTRPAIAAGWSCSSSASPRSGSLVCTAMSCRSSRSHAPLVMLEQLAGVAYVAMVVSQPSA